MYLSLRRKKVAILNLLRTSKEKNSYCNRPKAKKICSIFSYHMLLVCMFHLVNRQRMLFGKRQNFSSFESLTMRSKSLWNLVSISRMHLWTNQSFIHPSICTDFGHSLVWNFEFPELDFYCLCSLLKFISNMEKNPVHPFQTRECQKSSADR